MSNDWYLGIDFGTTGMSAVLLNEAIAQLYPLSWSSVSQEGEESSFRLPAVICVEPSTEPQSETRLSVAGLSSTLPNNHSKVFLQHFKPYLNLAIPYYSSQQQRWEPTLQLDSGCLVSLYWVQRSLQTLLATLSPASEDFNRSVQVSASGLSATALVEALGNLKGVILGYPAVWSETYRFNVREAVLGAKLVKHPEQIFFLEDTIATVLAGLPNPRHGDEQHPTPFALHNGGTVVINIGTTTTELALGNLPQNYTNLTQSDFCVRTCPYAGMAIEQDIVYQLLVPQLSEEQRQSLSLLLPTPVEPDAEMRDRLAVLLQRSALGQTLLKTAGYIKQILQHRQEFSFEFGIDCCTVSRQALEDKVIQPFLTRLNAEINQLLVQTGISEQGIYQVICSGGTATLIAQSKWLQQKFPNATLIQDIGSPTSCVVAAGLATLALYPQVLNHSQQQYSDFFLLLELIGAFTNPESEQRAYSVKEIMQRLEHRGVNTRACRDRLLAFLNGQLPSGLVPSTAQMNWLAEESRENQDYEAIAAPLFELVENQSYHANVEQCQRLRQYFQAILLGTSQKLDEPLAIELNMTTVKAQV
jgi:hypothetical protein